MKRKFEMTLSVTFGSILLALMIALFINFCIENYDPDYKTKPVFKYYDVNGNEDAYLGANSSTSR